jgi:hypothetical protein
MHTDNLSGTATKGGIGQVPENTADWLCDIRGSLAFMLLRIVRGSGAK